MVSIWKGCVGTFQTRQQLDAAVKQILTFIGAAQETVAQAGNVNQAPITAAGPYVVPGELDLTQAENGPLQTPSYTSRGYYPLAYQPFRVASQPQVMVGTPSGTTSG